MGLQEDRTMEINKVAFVGCGALGIMYGSQFIKELGAQNVCFIADEARIERYAQTGFYANDVLQDFRFVTPDAQTGPADLVIFVVKSYALADALPLAKNQVGKDTIILSFMNGIQSEGVIATAYGPDKVITSMVAGMDATRAGNAVHYVHSGYVGFGPTEGTDPEDLESLCRFFGRVHLPYELDEDIRKTMWWKFMLNSGVNQTSALLRAPYGLFQTCTYAQNLMMMAMREVFEVSKKLGIGLDEDDIGRAIDILNELAPEGMTSMCQDVEAGRPTEVDIFAGSTMELGAQLGVDVPVSTFLFNALKALECR